MTQVNNVRDTNSQGYGSIELKVIDPHGVCVNTNLVLSFD